MATPPQLSPEDRAKALAKAKEARTKRAQLRKEIASGKKDLKAVLKNANDPIVGRMKVKTLIEALPGCGKVKCEKIMAELKIADNRRVQGLGTRQVDGLLERLG